MHQGGFQVYSINHVSHPVKWRLRHSGSSGLFRVFDYSLHCRTWACLLCIFVLPPTSLIKVVTSGSLHWAYTYVPCLAFRVHVAGDLNYKIPFVVGVLRGRKRRVGKGANPPQQAKCGNIAPLSLYFCLSIRLVFTRFFLHFQSILRWLSVSVQPSTSGFAGISRVFWCVLASGSRSTRGGSRGAIVPPKTYESNFILYSPWFFTIRKTTFAI